MAHTHDSGDALVEEFLVGDCGEFRLVDVGEVLVENRQGCVRADGDASDVPMCVAPVDLRGDALDSGAVMFEAKTDLMPIAAPQSIATVTNHAAM